MRFYENHWRQPSEKIVLAYRLLHEFQHPDQKIQVTELSGAGLGEARYVGSALAGFATIGNVYDYSAQ